MKPQLKISLQDMKRNAKLINNKSIIIFEIQVSKQSFSS
jgi:hypothetical protein